VTLARPDRRAELKARHRAAIIAAARELLEEQGSPTFSVDDLAARADVARRTVFNHFASLDDVLLTVCADVLAVVVDEFLASVERTPVGDGSRASMFDEIAAAVDESDLPTAIATIARIIGVPGESDERANALADAAFARVGGRLLDEVARRNPGVDPLDAELLVGSLMNGVAVIAKHWIVRTDAVLDDASRAEWKRLLGRLFDGVRSGYMPT
jgi:AcrR family transcriptional regulator